MSKVLYGQEFPTTNLVDGQPFFRTDTDKAMWFTYDADNAQWLSEPFEAMVADVNASAGKNYGRRLAINLPIYAETVVLTTSVSTTNNSSDYWSIICNSRDTTRANTTAIQANNTATDAADTWVNSIYTPPLTQSPTYYGIVDFTLAKTGTPGNISFYASMKFRYIST